MTRSAGSAIAAAAIAMVACLACSRETEPSGLGHWRFPHTTLGDVTTGRCDPTDLNDGRKGTWCFLQPPIRIGGSVADVDLYFLGAEKSARLIEIQLKIRGCHEDELDQWMRSGFGEPIDARATRGYWKNAYLWAAALMPSEPGRCVVHFVPLSETAEIARLKQL